MTRSRSSAITRAATRSASSPHAWADKLLRPRQELLTDLLEVLKERERTLAARKAPVLLLSDPSAPVSLPERAAIFYRKIANNEGGGDCLARAIAQLKDGSEDGHAAVRNAIANELLLNRSKFEVRRTEEGKSPGLPGNENCSNNAPSCIILLSCSPIQAFVLLWLDGKAISFEDYVRQGFPSAMSGNLGHSSAIPIFRRDLLLRSCARITFAPIFS